MIPNFAVDSTVEKHVQALALNGDVDWKEGGQKLIEWQARKESGYSYSFTSQWADASLQAMEKVSR